MLSMKCSLLVLLAAAAVLGGITKTREEIEEYRKFLRDSQNGKYEPPLSREIELEQGAWERSGKFEGDIMLTEEQQQELVDVFSGNRNAIHIVKRLWPNRTLYYNISTEYFYGSDIIDIEDAMTELSDKTCINFVQRTENDPNWVQIKGFNGGCSSYVGIVGRGQTLNLEPDSCLGFGTIAHELMHALGFYHQQTAAERDDYVNIVWEKIRPGKTSNFRKETGSLSFGVEYDYGSVMHYSKYAFSIDRNYTLYPIKPTTQVIGQRDNLSESDIKKLNILYRCPGYEDFFNQTVGEYP